MLQVSLLLHVSHRMFQSHEDLHSGHLVPFVPCCNSVGIQCFGHGSRSDLAAVDVQYFTTQCTLLLNATSICSHFPHIRILQKLRDILEWCYQLHMGILRSFCGVVVEQDINYAPCLKFNGHVLSN